MPKKRFNIHVKHVKLYLHTKMMRWQSFDVSTEAEASKKHMLKTVSSDFLSLVTSSSFGQSGTKTPGQTYN